MENEILHLLEINSIEENEIDWNPITYLEDQLFLHIPLVDTLC
jgi:hypothetical protein